MRNADAPAQPLPLAANETEFLDIKDYAGQVSSGLTKREQFCLTMNVADTGDAELDAIIIKGNKQRYTADAIAAVISGVYGNCPESEYKRWGADFVKKTVFIATSLIVELEKVDEHSQKTAN